MRPRGHGSRYLPLCCSQQGFVELGEVALQGQCQARLPACKLYLKATPFFSPLQHPRPAQPILPGSFWSSLPLFLLSLQPTEGGG